MEEERFHSTVVWSTQNNEKFCKSCKGHTVKAQFAAFFKENYFSITLRSWNAAIASLDPIPFCETYAMHHGAMETIC